MAGELLILNRHNHLSSYSLRRAVQRKMRIQLYGVKSKPRHEIAWVVVSTESVWSLGEALSDKCLLLICILYLYTALAHPNNSYLSYPFNWIYGDRKKYLKKYGQIFKDHKIWRIEIQQSFFMAMLFWYLVS